MKRAPGRVWFLLLPLLGAAALAWVVWSAWGEAPPPAGGAQFGDTAIVHAAEAPAATAAAERHEVEQQLPGIFGRVVDVQGHAAAGFEVVLQPEDEEASTMPLRTPSVPTPKTARSDDDGNFAFAPLHAGAYHVGLRRFGGGMQQVVLADGERRRVDLQLAQPLCAVTMQLLRNGEPITSGRVKVRFGEADERFVAAEEGAFRFQTPPGRYQVLVCGGGAASNSTPWSMAGALYVAELALEVPAGQATFACTFALATNPLDVVVTSDGSGPLPKLQFTVRGTNAWGGAESTFTFESPDGRTGSLAELPPGDWTITAESPYLDAEPQPLQVAPGAGAQRVVIDGRRTTVVRLDLREQDGSAYVMPMLAKSFADSLPPLRCGGRELPCEDVAAALVPRPDGIVLGFQRVPPGLATWSLDDAQVDGVWHFLMFEPLPAAQLDVQPLGDNTLSIYLQPRAFVEIVACQKNGMESPRASVQVWLGQTQVAAVGVVRRSRWQGFLPPAEYRVVIEEAPEDGDAANRREHHVFVERRNLNLRLRP